MQFHTVYFLDTDGKLIDEPRRVAHGNAITPPEYTPPEGCSFHWSRSTDHVTEDVYCVALTQAAQPLDELHAPKDPQLYRVHVLDMRDSCPAGHLLPLGNWNAGEAINREDLACLHLLHTKRLRPFRLHVQCDTMLALTDSGVRAFCHNTMRPLDLLELAAPAGRQTAPVISHSEPLMQKGA